MKAAKTLSFVGLVAMGLALVYGFTMGNGWDEVVELVRFPWFNVSLVDVYVGFALFAAWIVYREKHLGIAVAWVVAITVLGNFIACLYALIALSRSGGDWSKLWMGARAPRPE